MRKKRAFAKRYNPMLPTELVVVHEQLRTKDGRFRFRLNWDIRFKYRKFMPVLKKHYEVQEYKSIRGSCSHWNAGTLDEVLWAIKRIELELEKCPGIRRSQSIHGPKGK